MSKKQAESLQQNSLGQHPIWVQATIYQAVLSATIKWL